MATLLFDFDGVLADTLDDLLNFGRIACEQLGLPRDPTSADLDALDNMSFVDYGRQLGLPELYIDDFVMRCLEMFEQRTQPPRIFDGMAQVISHVAELHQIGIITGNTTQTVEKFLQKNELQDTIQIILGVEQPGTKPEKIKRSLQELTQSEDSTYMIGDSVSDIYAAKQTSIKSIAVGWGHQSIQKLKAAEPDYLVKSPQELQQLLSKL